MKASCRILRLITLVGIAATPTVAQTPGDRMDDDRTVRISRGRRSPFVETPGNRHVQTRVPKGSC